MKNQALIEYWSNVRRAENLAYFLRQAILKAKDAIESAEQVRSGVLQTYVRDPESAPFGYQHLREPESGVSYCNRLTAPLKPAKEDFFGESFGWIWKGSLFVGLVWYLVSLITGWDSARFMDRVGMIIFVPIYIFGLAAMVAVIPSLILLVVRCIRVPIINQQSVEKWESDRVAIYRKAQESNREMEAKRGEIRILQEHIRKEIAHWEDELAQVEQEIKNMYDQKEIPKQARGIMPSHYILGYLEMGICTELEGIDGCFAQYLNDSRTDRICMSIQDVVRAVWENTAAVRENTQAINRVGNEILSGQERLYTKFEDVHGKLDSFASSVHADAQSIERQNDLRQASLDKLNSTQTAMAWNQYIAAERLGISRGVLKRP